MSTTAGKKIIHTLFTIRSYYLVKMEFQAELSTLEEMMLYIRQEAFNSGIQEKAANKMELACEEAIVNIVSYAYPQKKGPLAISCKKQGHRFEITLRDWGIPFNPIDVEVNPQIDQPMQERRVGGLGIFLLRKVIDEASYQRIDNENVLRLAFLI
jgi:serine/threonine-protein kinase RsbW